MNLTSKVNGLVAGAAAVVMIVAAPAGAHDAPVKGGSGSAPSMEMHKNMVKGMQEMQGMKPTGNVDHDFAMMMRHHHQQGIAMAQRQLKHGKDAKMREMAQKIVDSQKKEIAEFDEWMQASGHGSKK